MPSEDICSHSIFQFYHHSQCLQMRLILTIFTFSNKLWTQVLCKQCLEIKTEIGEYAAINLTTRPMQVSFTRLDLI